MSDASANANMFHAYSPLFAQMRALADRLALEGWWVVRANAL